MKKEIKVLTAMIGIIMVCTAFLFSACSNSTGGDDTHLTEIEPVRIGIAWTADIEYCTNIVAAIEETGGVPVLLNPVIDNDLEYENGLISVKGVSSDDYLNAEYSERVKQNTYHNSNVADVVADVDAVIFAGGEDISPMLLKDPEEWIGIEVEKDFNATRDVSDYLLMSYCIDNDIPTLGFCRGMQMMAIVSGASIIQDIPAYFEEKQVEYAFQHRKAKSLDDPNEDFAPHDIIVLDKDSHIFDAFRSTVVKSVPSWHHQAVKSVDGTKLRVTSICDTNGLDIIESVERTDKHFVAGYQFHPEAVIGQNKQSVDNENLFMDKETALKIFKLFIDYVVDDRMELAA